ncbi:Protein of unknown function [Acetitomaculum ruminis DSM 5522]|uniref:DUF3021 domain-containing protein n=1 Tax=Acetitomaculum ruminis DSM 5522 TaxID=1120918 RepID=A0A1I1AFR3_9FIRM|nr:DUF3021 domain-containing protein [Acetitomaculum ruminis]SFB35173.1 Protein of unknown function [Acetitomaculum ruminis DSM 5522]
MRDLLKSSIMGIGMAMAIFCIVGIGFDIGFKGNFTLENYRFTKMILGCVLIGLGFGVPTMVYKKDNLPMPIRILIHMGTGCIVYTIVAFFVGWLGNKTTITQGIIIALIQLGVAFIIWFIFMMHYRAEAKKINEKIQNMK